MGKSIQEINQGMMGTGQERLSELGALESSINGQLADPLQSQYYGTQLDQQLANVQEAQSVLNQEMAIRGELDAACKNSTFKNPEQDPAVKDAQQKLNEHRKKNEKYYKNGKVADPCVTCIQKKTKFRFPPDVIKAAQDSQRETGVVHGAFRPAPRRFKDYIAHPKPNGYRSLHTTVHMPIGGHEELVEVQIRTREMHLLAEHGVAAHWRYKHGGGEQPPAARFVYALTPAGEIKRLPPGATPLDFAYSVHTALGHGYAGAKVNGRMVSADTPLRSGDVVEVIRSARARPTEGQLTRVRTARARNRIRAGLPTRAAWARLRGERRGRLPGEPSSSPCQKKFAPDIFLSRHPIAPRLLP